MTAFAAGYYVVPRLDYQRYGMPNDPDLNVDFSGARTAGPGRVVEPLPTEIVDLASYTWDPTDSTMRLVDAPEFAYYVEILNVDSGAIETRLYPESELQTPHEAGVAFGNAEAIAYDGDAMSADLARITAAERYAR